MKKKKTRLVLLLVFLIIPKNIVNAQDSNYISNAKRDILCLMMAYPDFIDDVVIEDNKIYLVMKSKERILYDDKINKNYSDKIYNADLQDTLEQLYPMNISKKIMNENFDPGRFRNYSLLNCLYGKSENEIGKNLVNVNIGYTNAYFNKNNEAANSLENAMKELVSLTKRDKNTYNFIFPCSGTYNYRYISGTNLLSPHSYGIAIDLKYHDNDYWKWNTKEAGEKRLTSYPNEIVEIFENNNFVWGGKWNHFDILHFEYRPEIILKSKYFSNKSDSKNWYDGAPIEDELVKNIITKIDKII
ncbi:MAG: M15 family metallopeptidase [Clostridiaceae bacterium]